MPNAVTRAREKAGIRRWTAARNAGISQQVLRNLERTPDATRKTRPQDCKLRTVLALCELYWPHLKLTDLVPDSKFELVPISKLEGQRLRRNVGKPLD